MDKLIVVGSGGHARSCIDVIEQQNKFSIIGIIDKQNNNGNLIAGYSQIGSDTDLPHLISKSINLFIGIGFIKSSLVRKEYYERAKNLKYLFPKIISPHSYISDHSNIDEGTIVMHDALINSHCNIEKNCIINSKALIEHDVTVGAHSHISTAAVINGAAVIGKGCFIGSNATVGEGVTIGDESIISAGAYIKNNIPPKTTYK